MIRYHEDIIHKRKRGYNERNENGNILRVEGISKNINEIKVGLPDRKDKIQQEISRIYQGKHAVYRRDYSK